MSRKLFFTLEATLLAMDQGLVGFGDLREGLFALDCTREHAVRPWNPYDNRDTQDTDELTRLFGNSQHGRRLHMLLRDALAEADDKGHVTWLSDNTDLHDADSLNDFLERNGYGRPIPEGEIFDGFDLEHFLREAGFDLEVVC